MTFVTDAADALLTLRQTPAQPPNIMLRTLGAPIANAAKGEAGVASTLRPVTQIPDPTPAVRAIKKRLVTYKRKDGVDLSFTLYTPPDYKEGTRVPAILDTEPGKRVTLQIVRDGGRQLVHVTVGKRPNALP